MDEKTMSTAVTASPATQEDLLAQLNRTYRTMADVSSLGKNVANASGKSLHVPKLYVTHGKASDKSSKIVYNLDTSSLLPSHVTLLSSNFVKAYTKELDAAMNDDSSEKNSLRFVEVCKLMRNSDQLKTPVTIVSGKYVRRLPDIAKALNAFINDNADAIKAITTMLNNETIKDLPDGKDTPSA